MGLKFLMFFFQCFQRETDEIKRQVFKNLAFQKGFLIFKRQDDLFLRIDDKTEFKLPNEYSHKLHQKLSDLIWDSTSEFEITRKAIQNNSKQLVKKQDKNKLVDSFVLQNDFEDSKRKKAIIVIAIILKLLSLKNLEIWTEEKLISEIQTQTIKTSVTSEREKEKTF